MNSNLLNVFLFTKLEKVWVFFLKPDPIPKLHILKLNLLLSTMVTIVVTMCIVRKGTIWWPKNVGNHYYWSDFYWIFYLDFFPWKFRIHRPAEKGRPYLHLLHRHLCISLKIPRESSPLHIAISGTQTKNHWFLSGSC